MKAQKINELKAMNLRILSHDISVIFETPGALGDRLMGRARLAEQIININQNAHIDCIFTTFIHEVMHLISFMNNLELSESQVESLGVGMFSLLRDNPHFLKMIQEQYGQEEVDGLKSVPEVASG